MTVLVVMGVAGCGKTTVGQIIAARQGWAFQEGDALHPPSNVAKMAGGTALTDADRWPWLQVIAGVIDGWRAEGRSGVVTCSALKTAYRDILVGGRADVRLVYLKGEKAVIAARMAARKGHFMPTALLDSQFETLQEPGAAERALVVDIGPAPEAIAETVIARLADRGE